jgi:Phosphotransferase enzyme family
MRPERAGVRQAYASLEEMLSPVVLTGLLRQPVGAVRREAFATAGWSSTEASFEAVYLGDEARPSLVTKTVARGKDWVSIATDDDTDREVWTWESGLLDRLTSPAAHAVLAVARTDDSYSILMRNLSDHLLPDEGTVSAAPACQQFVVEGLASIHAEFWMDDRLDDPYYGLSTLARQISHGAPSTMARVQARIGRSPVVELVEGGWAKLPDLMDAHLAADVRALAEDPRPVVDAAGRFPWTLVHADPRPANLAVDLSSGTVYFLDWARPLLAPPAYDLFYWLFNGNRHLTVPVERLVDAYAVALRLRLGSRFSADWWSGQLEVSLVAFLASFAPIIAQVKPEALGWWADRARPGLLALA